ncbi:MAG: DUF2779 domain-containing protein [Chitinophagales bacterium]|nr:DUF2779 domain-containing protein [Chitinophagales bacterium]
MQCQKALYLYKNHYELRDTISQVQKNKFNRGHRVGILAQSLFPGGKDCTPPSVSAYDQSVQATKALVQAQYPVIYEAAFKDKGVLIALDILVNRDGKWYAYEVKSSLKISQTYIKDISIQYYVMRQTGLEIEDVFIVHLNGDYILENDTLDLYQLFKIVSVKDKVLKKQGQIEKAIEDAWATLRSTKIPDIAIGEHCFKPYTCDFLSYCWQGKEKSPVLHLAGTSLAEKIEWITSGVTELKDIPKSALSSRRVHAQFKAEMQGGVYIEKESFTKFMKGIDYPLYFFDIEAFQPAVPKFNHTSSFEPIPFQFSLHYAESEDAGLQTTEYITHPGQDGREEFLTTFIQATQLPGKILIFNTLLEKRVLNILIETFPKYKQEVKERLKRMVDMETPFSNDWFYHSKMKGGYSMKNILPALVEDMDYRQIDINDGMNAMLIYHDLWYEKDESKVRRELDHLLAYCRMDTLGLYYVFKKMREFWGCSDVVM